MIPELLLLSLGFVEDAQAVVCSPSAMNARTCETFGDTRRMVRKFAPIPPIPNGLEI